jgi:hypothetical protein
MTLARNGADVPPTNTPGPSSKPSSPMLHVNSKKTKPPAKPKTTMLPTKCWTLSPRTPLPPLLIWATATASDRTMIADLTATNRDLFAQRRQRRGNLTSTPHHTTRHYPASPAHAPAHAPGERTELPLNNNNCCLAHGYVLSDTHTSISCTNSDDGHQLEASTRADPRGGSARDRNCPNRRQG